MQFSYFFSAIWKNNVLIVLSTVRFRVLVKLESDTTERLHFHALEKEMATHSSVLAWRIPGMGEPGRLPSMGVAQSRTRLK